MAPSLLDAASTSQTQEGVILIYICWCHLFVAMPDWFITAQKERWPSKRSSRCESSLHEPILIIHYWCCIFVIRTSLLHYAYQVHGEYHRLPTMKSMRTFRPPFEPSACTIYRRVCRKQVSVSVKNVDRSLKILECLSDILIHCDFLRSFFHDHDYKKMTTSCMMRCPLRWNSLKYSLGEIRSTKELHSESRK